MVNRARTRAELTGASPTVSTFLDLMKSVFEKVELPEVHADAISHRTHENDANYRSSRSSVGSSSHDGLVGREPEIHATAPHLDDDDNDDASTFVSTLIDEPLEPHHHHSPAHDSNHVVPAPRATHIYDGIYDDEPTYDDVASERTLSVTSQSSVIEKHHVGEVCKSDA